MILAGSPAGKVGCADIKVPFFCCPILAYNESMDVRRAKQIIYGAFYLIVLGVIFAAVYFRFLKPAPSCFDAVQNQGEAGVDCGGPCAAVCLPSALQKIAIVGGVSFFPSSAGHDTLLAQVANPNSGLAAPVIDYRFDLFDATGTLIGSVPGGSFMYASEVKYLLAANVAVPVPVDHAVLAMQDPVWVEAAKLGLVPQFKNPLPVTGSAISSSTITVNGRIVNSDLVTFTNILIVAVFRGTAGGAPLGASQTKVDRLAPNEAQDFSVMYPAGAAIDPSLTQLYAYALRQ